MARILIVDDERFVRRLVGALLESDGHQVVEAEDAPSTLAAICQDPPDLVVADTLMPGVDGYALARQIRARPSTAAVPIILLTGLSAEADPLRQFVAGVDDVLGKAEAPLALVPRVRALLAELGGEGSSTADGAGDLATPKAARAPAVGCVAAAVTRIEQLPRGANVLVRGSPLFVRDIARRFVATGLCAGEPTLVVELEQDAAVLRQELVGLLPLDVSHYEGQWQLRAVEASVWADGIATSGDARAVEGALELESLAATLLAAGEDVGQSVAGQAGGRRVIASPGALTQRFAQAQVRQFMRQLARSSAAYGSATTLFLEDGVRCAQPGLSGSWIDEHIEELTE
jgi:CheY-like chemotaxis protein